LFGMRCFSDHGLCEGLFGHIFILNNYINISTKYAKCQSNDTGN
jgi:hypothetical protein